MTPWRKAVQSEPKEVSLNKKFCDSVGGQTETRHYYTYPGGRSYIMVDCETSDVVYDGGMDRRSSLDSVQQALFASDVTGQTSCRSDLQYCGKKWAV